MHAEAAEEEAEEIITEDEVVEEEEDTDLVMVAVSQEEVEGPTMMTGGRELEIMLTVHL